MRAESQRAVWQIKIRIHARTSGARGTTLREFPSLPASVSCVVNWTKYGQILEANDPASVAFCFVSIVNCRLIFIFLFTFEIGV